MSRLVSGVLFDYWFYCHLFGCDEMHLTCMVRLVFYFVCHYFVDYVLLLVVMYSNMLVVLIDQVNILVVFLVSVWIHVEVVMKMMT